MWRLPLVMTPLIHRILSLPRSNLLLCTMARNVNDHRTLSYVYLVRTVVRSHAHNVN